MIATTLEMQNEAIRRIKTLIKKLNLNAKVLEYFKDGKKYYSYLTGGGFLGSVDTIQYDEDYEKAVKWFEKKYSNLLVYHVIETIISNKKLLSFLYVGNKKESWKMERLQSDNGIMSYVFNLNSPELSEFGYITIDKFGNSGALVRTDIYR